MKKQLNIFVALGCLSGAAVAQSSTVAIFGLVDLSMVHTSGNGQTQTRMLDGTVYGPGSRWGIRASEDLGGGLKANVLLEAGFLADTGNSAQGGRAFGRQSYISLSSANAGEIRLGRQYIFHDETQFAFNPTAIGGTILNPAGLYTVKSGVFTPILSAPRIDNAIQYISPTINGFRLQAMIAPGEGTQDRYHGLKGSYSNGPLNVVAAYEQSKALVVPPGGKSSVNKIIVGGASYNFGTVKIMGGYERGKDLTTGTGTQLGTLTFPGLTSPATDLKAYTMGASMPIGATTLMVNYQHSRFSDVSGAGVTIGRYGFGATYAFSKRTAVYGVVALASGDLKDSVNEKRAFQVGLRHSF